MAAANKVIAGDYQGALVTQEGGSIHLAVFHAGTDTLHLPLDKTTVESYETVSANKQKNMGSALGLAAAGAFLLGPLGLLAGAMAGDTGIYTISLTMKDGKRCLIELDDPLYKALMEMIY